MALDAGALSFQHSLEPGCKPVPEEGHQQPRDAEREIEPAFGVVAVGERPDTKAGPDSGEDEHCYAIPARSHGVQGYRSAAMGRWDRSRPTARFFSSVRMQIEGQFAIDIEVEIARREAIEEGGRRQRRQELPGALEREAMCRKVLERRLGKAERNGPLADTATRENAIAAQVLAKRCELAITAARLDRPPTSARSRRVAWAGRSGSGVKS
jgi:hypothetical protein